MLRVKAVSSGEEKTLERLHSKAPWYLHRLKNGFCYLLKGGDVYKGIAGIRSKFHHNSLKCNTVGFCFFFLVLKN